ncbi:MAG TPA: shikimate kinase [Terriglobales bacterium]
MTPLVLVGFMGCGKSTVGRLLSTRLGWHFCDLDERIEARAGLSIAAIFAQRGEADYRRLESHELVIALGEAGARRTVLALGGGTFAQPQNLEPIRESGGATVYLEVPIEELLTRCSGMANRPLFRDEASFRTLYEYRIAFYREARFTVPAGQATPLEVAERVLGVLNHNGLLAD